MLRRSEYDDALDVYFVLAYRKATLDFESDCIELFALQAAERPGHRL